MNEAKDQNTKKYKRVSSSKTLTLENNSHKFIEYFPMFEHAIYYHSQFHKSDYDDIDDKITSEIYLTTFTKLCLLNDDDLVIFVQNPNFERMEQQIQKRLYKSTTYTKNYYNGKWKRESRQMSPMNLTLKRNYLLFGNLFIRYVTEYGLLIDEHFDELINERTTQILTKMKENINSYDKIFENISWITENAGTQITSTMNPIVKNPKDWYKDCFDENMYQYYEKFI
jgi:hypothetical protein